MYATDLTDFVKYFECQGMMPEGWQELDFQSFRELMNNNFQSLNGDSAAPAPAVWNGQELLGAGDLVNVRSLFEEVLQRQAGADRLAENLAESESAAKMPSSIEDYPLLP